MMFASSSSSLHVAVLLLTCLLLVHKTGRCNAFAFAPHHRSFLSLTTSTTTITRSNRYNLAARIAQSASSPYYYRSSRSRIIRRSVVVNVVAKNDNDKEVEEQVVEVDCIIIGSGIGGLSCASLLAATGRTVTVRGSPEAGGLSASRPDGRPRAFRGMCLGGRTRGLTLRSGAEMPRGGLEPPTWTL